MASGAKQEETGRRTKGVRVRQPAPILPVMGKKAGGNARWQGKEGQGRTVSRAGRANQAIRASRGSRGGPKGMARWVPRANRANKASRISRAKSPSRGINRNSRIPGKANPTAKATRMRRADSVNQANKANKDNRAARGNPAIKVSRAKREISTNKRIRHNLHLGRGRRAVRAKRANKDSRPARGNRPASPNGPLPCQISGQGRISESPADGKAEPAERHPSPESSRDPRMPSFPERTAPLRPRISRNPIPRRGKNLIENRITSAAVSTTHWQAQAGVDFARDPLMTAPQQRRAEAQSQGLAKSREVDEFARRHRIPESFRSYLKDFFQP